MKPIRVLHVLGNLNPGGIETWLLHVARNSDSNIIAFDFAVQGSQRYTYDDELERLGCTIYRLPKARSLTYFSELARIIASNNYDVIHAHLHHFSGPVAAVAKLAGARRVVVHSHNDTRQKDATATLSRRLYIVVSRLLLAVSADRRLAVSVGAAEALFSAMPLSRASVQILHCGLDFNRFKEKVDSSCVRQEIGLRSSSTVVVHVGRFVFEKNQTVLVDALQALTQAGHDFELLFIGDGRDESAVRARVQQLGLQERVLFCGTRSDVHRILLGVADIFAFPSRSEGLGLAAIEAQAAGVRTVLSAAVPNEAVVIHELVRRVDANATAETWANALLDASNDPVPEGLDPLHALESSPFDVRTSTASLLKVYCE